MKIEGVAGHAQNAHALGRQQAPERPQPGKTTGGNTDTEPSVIVNITDAADQPLATRGRGATPPGHQARAMMESYRAMGAETGDMRFGQIISRIARGLDASELFVVPEPEPEAEEVTTGMTIPLAGGESEGDGAETGAEAGPTVSNATVEATPPETTTTATVEVAPLETTTTSTVDPNLVAALLLDEETEESDTSSLVVEPLAVTEDETT